MNRTPPLANVLPRDAARLLQEAALTPNPRGDPLARLKALERATGRVKAMYPQFFQQESVGEQRA